MPRATLILQSYATQFTLQQPWSSNTINMKRLRVTKAYYMNISNNYALNDNNNMVITVRLEDTGAPLVNYNQNALYDGVNIPVINSTNNLCYLKSFFMSSAIGTVLNYCHETQNGSNTEWDAELNELATVSQLTIYIQFNEQNPSDISVTNPFLIEIEWQ